MKQILLIDIDARIPIQNLALMQLSAWHKAQGDTTGFDTPNPDKVSSAAFSRKMRRSLTASHPCIQTQKLTFIIIILLIIVLNIVGYFCHMCLRGLCKK